MRDLGAVSLRFQFRFFAGADIHDRAKNKHALGRFNWRQSNFNRELRSIFASGKELAPGSHRSRHRFFKKGATIAGVSRTETSRHQVLDRPPDDVFASITE